MRPTSREIVRSLRLGVPPKVARATTVFEVGSLLELYGLQGEFARVGQWLGVTPWVEVV